MSQSERPVSHPYSRDQLCAELQITPRTLRRYVRAGRVRLVQTNGSYFYFPQEPLAVLRKPLPLATGDAARSAPSAAQPQWPDQAVPLVAHQLALEKLTELAGQVVAMGTTVERLQQENRTLRESLHQQREIAQSLTADARDLRQALALLKGELVSLGPAPSRSFPRLVPLRPDTDEH